MSKFLSLLTLLLFSVPALAQQRQVGVSGVFTISPGTGHEPGVGARVDTVLPYGDFLALAAEATWEWQKKSYVGDGHAVRARVEGRAYLFEQGGERERVLAPFASVGAALSRQFTSQYSKGAANLIIGGGVNIRHKFVPYYRHYFQEKFTANKGSANEFGCELYLPLSEQSPWLIRAGLSATRVRFLQPNGPAAGWHTAWATQMSMGVGYRF